MRYVTVAIGAVTLCLLSQTAFPGEGKTVQNPIHLFNGKDLDGFYTYLRDRGRDTDPRGVFTVQEGILRISGEEWGCLTTVDSYGDYHLVLEYRWGDETFAPREERARDSGVLLHSVGEDGAYGGAWMHSIECQLIEGGTGDFIVVGDGTEAFNVTCPAAPKQQNGRHVYKADGEPVSIRLGRINWFGRDPNWKDTKGYRGQWDLENPCGEWNRLECIADGETITIALNGVPVNQCLEARPTKGRIQIQSEGAEIFIRRVDLLPVAAVSTGQTPSPRRRRFIYNSDGNNMLIYKGPPMTPEHIWGYVDEIAETDVTALFICPNIGMNMNYPSQVAQMIGEPAGPGAADPVEDPSATRPGSLERAIVNLRSLVAAGHDPLGLVIERAQAKGLETFISFRLNEVHAVEQEESVLLSRFWQDHPEWHIGNPGDDMPPVYHRILGPNTHPIVGGWLPGGLDFAVPEVRSQRLAEIRECCERYPIDGIDLDFQRFPMYFRPGQEAEGKQLMTAWMREIREMTRAVGDLRGRPLLVSVRIMATPEQNELIGLDPIAWANEGLVDMVTVSHYLRNDFPLPAARYRTLLPDNVPLYASIEVAPTEAAYRRIARGLWREGVDGILLYNFFTTRERGQEPPFALLHQLGDPTTIPPEAPADSADATGG